MGQPTFKQKIINFIKHLVYKITLPIYLWSIGYKTLDDYLNAIVEQGKLIEQTPSNNQS